MMHTTNEIKAQAAGALNRTGAFIYGEHGHTVKIFYVAGGGFCTVDVRDDATHTRVAELSGTRQWSHEALALFADAIDAVKMKGAQS